jgi:glycosyltransferase involved in cell wall biosynthesis
MRVAMFTCNYLPLRNGVVTSLVSYGEQLTARGHAVVVFAPAYPRLAPVPSPVTVHRFASLPAPTHASYALPIPCSARIRRALHAFRPDVIHAQHPFLLGPYALRAARRLGVPTVFTYHTRYDEYARVYTPLAGRLAARWARRQSLAFAGKADAVVALTRATAAMLAGSAARARIHVIPTGVAPRPPAEDRATLRVRLGIPGPATVAIFAGRLAAEKNLPTLLQAHAQLVPEFPDAWLLLLGGGDQGAPLVAAARRAGVAHRVVLAGEVAPERVWDYYAAAEYFVSASTSEVQPLAPLEAMAAGLPLVAADYPGLEDYVDPGVSGLIAEPTASALAAAMRQVLGSPGLRARLAAGARAKGAALSLEASAGRLIELYAGLCGQRRRAPPR